MNNTDADKSRRGEIALAWLFAVMAFNVALTGAWILRF